MAQILVLSEPADADGEMIYSERVGAVHLEGHAGAQLVERLRWAVRDAQAAEHRAMLRAATAPDAERHAAA